MRSLGKVQTIDLGKLADATDRASRQARMLLLDLSLPVCRVVSAGSANRHTCSACQLATPVRAASGKLNAQFLGESNDHE